MQMKIEKNKKKLRQDALHAGMKLQRRLAPLIYSTS